MLGGEPYRDAQQQAEHRDRDQPAAQARPDQLGAALGPQPGRPVDQRRRGAQPSDTADQHERRGGGEEGARRDRAEPARDQPGDTDPGDGGQRRAREVGDAAPSESGGVAGTARRWRPRRTRLAWQT
ncbi:hypothetical protein ACFQZ4_20705 [Catellatospora coxensis]